MLVQKIMDSGAKIRLIEKIIDCRDSFSVSELARLSGIPKATVSLIVNEWSEAGLVHCEWQGRNKLVKMNTGFCLFPEISRMFRITGGMQRQLITRLGKVKALKSRDVVAVIAFGSRTRKDFRAESDLDVLVVLEDKESKAAEGAMEELIRVSGKTGVRYSPAFISKKELAERVAEKDEFAARVLAEGKIIKGGKWLEHLQAAP